MDLLKYWLRVGFIISFFSTVLGQMDPRVVIVDTTPPTQASGRIYGIISQDVTMSCYVEDLPIGLNVRWQKVTIGTDGKENIEPIAKDESVEDNTKYSIEKPTGFTWRLRIRALQVKDEAKYNCFVQTTSNNNRKQANRTVISTERPMILLGSSSDTFADEGDSVKELHCNATGRPQPTIIWQREGNAVLPGGGVTRYSSILKIYDVPYTARGRYICEAVNEVGLHRRSLLLTVNFEPKVKVNAARVGQMVGYRTQLICDIVAYPLPVMFDPDPSKIQVAWYKGSNVVVPDGNRIIEKKIIGASEKVTYELELRQVVKEDYGQYVCNIRNHKGGNTGTIDLFETDTPQPDKTGRILAGNVSTVSILTLLTALLGALIFSW